MRLICLLLLLLVIGGLLPSVSAQDSATSLSLTAETNALQTGQEYIVSINISGAPATWSANLEIAYDPSLLYIMGTQAGSPVRPGSFYAPPESSVVVRNAVNGNRLVYTISMLAPAESVSGGGTIGTFRIYPLAPGAATLSFHQAQVTTVSTSTDAGGNRLTTSEEITFTPVLLELSISGSPVEPPSEVTATPPPTETPLPVQPAIATQQPGLVNATAAPVTTPDAAAPASPDNQTLLVIAIGAMAVGAVGLVVVLLLWRRAQGR